jgi:PAS domain S-box-containing protein
VIDAGELSAPFLRLAGSIDAIIYVAAAEPGRAPLFVSPAVERFFGYAPEEWLADPDSLQRHLHPGDAERVRGEVASWLAANDGAPLHLKYALVAKDGRVCWCRETLLRAGEGGSALAGAIVDVTELKVLQNTLEAVFSAARPREALLAFCDALAQALALDWTAWVSPARRERLLCAHGRLGVRESARWLPWNSDEGGLGERAAREGRTLVWEGGAAAQPEDPLSDLGQSLAQIIPEARFALAAPVPGAGALLGISRRPCAQTRHRLRIAEALAQQAAVALQRADLVAQLEQTSSDRRRLAEALVRAQEEERSRLSRELHDGAGQTLTAVAIQLDLAERAVPEAARAPLQRARREVEQTLEELRRLSHALRPAVLDRLGLGEALREMCRALLSEQLAVRLVLPEGGLHLPAEQATALFRIAQAALTNVVRHARATQAEVRVELDTDAKTVALEVIDDGRGFDQTVSTGSLGLFAMRERAEGLGGTLSVRSAPGEGTRVRAILPLS